MPLANRGASRKKRRSQTRLGRLQEAEAPALQLRLAQVQTDWQDKLSHLPGLVIAAMLCYVLFYFFTDDRFFVWEATVAGHQRITAMEIYRQSGVEGHSIFFLNGGEVSSRIEQIPAIKQALVACQLPDRIYIEIVEREPVYIWQIGDRTYWLDEEGVIMEPRGQALNGITFLDADAQDRQPGSRVEPEILQAAHDLQAWLPREKTFQWSRSQGLSFLHRDGYPIYLGQLDDWQQKMITLRALADDFSKRGVKPEFVDLRFAGRSYYR